MDPLEHLIDAMLQSSAQLVGLVEHMAEWAEAHTSAAPMPVVLRALLLDALEPLGGGADAEAVATAAQVVSAATVTIAAELRLVPVAVDDEPPGLDGEPPRYDDEPRPLLDASASPCAFRRHATARRRRGASH